MSEILVYTEPMNSAVHKKLLAAGIIPVRVTDTKSVRLLSVEPNATSAEIMLKAALTAIGDDDHYNLKVSRKFISELKKYLVTVPEKVAGHDDATRQEDR